MMSHTDDSKRKRESFSSTNSSHSGFISKKTREGSSLDDSDMAELDTLAQQSVSVVIQPPSPLNIPPPPSNLGGMTHTASSNLGGWSHITHNVATPSTSTDKPTLFDPSDPALIAAAQLPGSPSQNVKVIADLLNSTVTRFESAVRRDMNTCINNNNTILLNKFRSEFKDEIATEVYNGLKLDIQVENDALRSRCSRLEAEMSRVKDNQANIFEIMSKKCVEFDQQARSLNMRVHGIKEYPNENTQYLKFVLMDLVAQRLNIYIREHDIESIHRIGKRLPGKSRSILCKFARSDTKSAVIGNRKYLKGSGVIFSEDLCPELQQIHDLVKGHINIQSIWAWNGKVHAKDKYDKLHTLNFGTDWIDFFDELKPPGHRGVPPVSASATQANTTHRPGVVSTSVESSVVSTSAVSSVVTTSAGISVVSTSAGSSVTSSSASSSVVSTAPPHIPTPVSQPASTAISSTLQPMNSTPTSSMVLTAPTFGPPVSQANTAPMLPPAVSSATQFPDIGRGFHSSPAPVVTAQLYPSLNSIHNRISTADVNRYVQPHPRQPQQQRSRPRPDISQTPDFRGLRPVRSSTPHPRNIPPGQPRLQGYFQRQPLPQYGT